MSNERESDRQAAALERYVLEGYHGRRMYGTQYGMPEDDAFLRSIRDTWLLPSLLPGDRVLEIGAGGGRWSRHFVGKVKSAVLVDGTEASELAVKAWYDWRAFRFIVSKDGVLATVANASIDYCWTFDTFVHFDVPLFDRYLSEIGRALVPGGKLHLHYARLWPGHEQVNRTCFRYRDEEEVAAVLKKAGLELTGRRVEIHTGFGSVLVEARRQGPA